MLLFHGTTQHRALLIEAEGPNPDYQEPGGSDRAEHFDVLLDFGPFEAVGKPEEYACKKAAIFPNEGGPAILIIEVPNEVIALAVDETFFPLSQGLVQFDKGAGLEKLRADWSKIRKRVVSLKCT